MLHCLGETTEDGHSKAKILVFHLLSAGLEDLYHLNCPEVAWGGGGGVGSIVCYHILQVVN